MDKNCKKKSPTPWKPLLWRIPKVSHQQSVASTIRSHPLLSSNTKDILLGSGANVLCLHDPTFFDTLDVSTAAKVGSMAVADGSPSTIQAQVLSLFRVHVHTRLLPQSSFLKEIAALYKRGCDTSADLPIGDIPPELIFQLSYAHIYQKICRYRF